MSVHLRSGRKRKGKRVFTIKNIPRQGVISAWLALNAYNPASGEDAVAIALKQIFVLGESPIIGDLSELGGFSVFRPPLGSPNSVTIELTLEKAQFDYLKQAIKKGEEKQVFPFQVIEGKKELKDQMTEAERREALEKADATKATPPPDPKK